VQVREIDGVGIEMTLNLTALFSRLMERLSLRQDKVDDKDPREKVYQKTAAFIRSTSMICRRSTPAQRSPGCSAVGGLSGLAVAS
jgi:hypothetical protein